MEDVESVEVVEEESTDTGSSTVMERVTVRLPPKTIAMFDTAVENGLATNRSDGIRKILSIFENMAGIHAKVVVPLVFHLLSEPIELILWIQHRLSLMGHDDRWRRLYAGHTALLMKASAKHAAALGEPDVPVNLPLFRDEVLRVLTSFDPFGYSPEAGGEFPAPPPEGQSPAGALLDLVLELSKRIRLGAEASEIADKILAMIYLAGVHHYYGAEELRSSLCAMADAANIQSTLLGAEGQEEGQEDPSGFVDAYLAFRLGVPPLYDDEDLSEAVLVLLMADFRMSTDLPGEEVVEEKKTETEQPEG